MNPEFYKYFIVSCFMSYFLFFVPISISFKFLIFFLLREACKFCIFVFQFRYIDARLPSGYDVSSVKTCAFFGTHVSQRATTDILWRLGPSFLLEDPLVDETVSTIYKLGPSYSGCFQAPIISEHYEVFTLCSRE